MIKVGITGIGFMGWIHYLAYQKTSGIEISAICARNQDKLAGDWTSIQGNFGLFRRAEIVAEGQDLRVQLAQVKTDVARMENLTSRLSDDYLDLDLLDEQTRKVLGMIRSDEIVIR